MGRFWIMFRLVNECCLHDNTLTYTLSRTHLNVHPLNCQCQDGTWQTSQGWHHQRLPRYRRLSRLDREAHSSCCGRGDLRKYFPPRGILTVHGRGGLERRRPTERFAC